MVGVPAMMDLQFAQQLKQLKAAGDDFEVVTGGTMCASDFYEGRKLKPINLTVIMS